MKKEYRILGLIIFVGLFLRLWNITGPDMIGDDAHYSFRALGWFDYVASENLQSTPVSWFPVARWWQYLSFHDHPPLVFLIQFLFFSIFGDSLLVARLPFVLAGALSIWAIFILAKELWSPRAGLIAAAVLAFSNYSLWLSRFAYLDVWVPLWTILAIYFFARANKNSKNYILWWIFLALGILTKYTFVFILPLFFVAIILWRKNIWQDKNFYFGLALFIMLVSPLVIYNLAMLKTRGHFDAAVSSAFFMHPEDFKGLQRTLAEGGFHPKAFFLVLYRNMSLGLQVLIYGSLALLIYVAIKTRKWQKYYFIFGGLFFAAIILYLTSVGDKYSIIILPFLALALSLAVDEISKINALLTSYFLLPAFSIILAWEIFFTIQGHIIASPIINNNLLFANNKSEWQGNNQLEHFVTNFYKQYPDPSYIIFSKNPQMLAFQVPYLKNILRRPNAPKQQKHLLLYDDKINWYASMWIFERRRIYDVAAIGKISDFYNLYSALGTKQFLENGFEDATFIIPTENYLNQNLTAKPTEEFLNFLDKIKAQKTLSYIEDIYGQKVFNVYLLPLKFFNF